MTDEMNQHLVIVGAGCAGAELACSARTSGWQGEITLVGEEAELPYHRPPLSKAYLTGAASPESLLLKAPALYSKLAVTLRTGVRVSAIERSARLLRLADGGTLPYGVLALATGGRPRTLPAAREVAGGAVNLHYLRTVESATAIRGELTPGARLVVIGGGYVGLEVAAAAIKSGMRVTLLEAAPRLLERVTAPVLSAFYEAVHREAGVDVRTGTQAENFEMSPDGSRVVAVVINGGERLLVDAVVVGIGLVPNCELARQAGLAVDDGILVDGQLRTGDAAVFALGDCARFPSALYDRRLRIESVPNALEHARLLAAILCGKEPRPETAPWFWSDQYELGLKMSGLSAGHDRIVLRGTPDSRSFCAFYLRGARVLAADTVNRAADFMQAKRLVNQQAQVDVAMLEDESIPLKQIADLAPPAAGPAR
ncbi:MAG: FAD-dependent oxidoreductase [Pseudomonadota bacterium]